MARAFLFLGLGLLGLFVGVAAVGLWFHDGAGDRHVLLAVFAILFACFVQVVTFTYFTVSGKMIVQAVHLGGLDPTPLEIVRSLKRSMARYLGLSFFSLLLATATGAAHWRTPDQSSLHVLAVTALFMVHCLVLYKEYTLVVQNDAISGRVLAAYRRRRDDLAHAGPDKTAVAPESPAEVLL